MNVGIEARAALVNLGLAAAVLAAAFLLSGLPPREIALLLLKVQALLCGGLLVQALFAPLRRELLDPAHPRGRLFLATAVVLALSLAGVFSAFANADGMLLLRQGGEGKIPVRYCDLIADDKERAEIFVQPGDTMVVR